VKPQVSIGPSNDGRRHGRGTYLFSAFVVYCKIGSEFGSDWIDDSTFLSGTECGMRSDFALDRGNRMRSHNIRSVTTLSICQSRFIQVISAKSKDSSQSSVWTFVYPGCNIFQWETEGFKKIRNKLDCSKLVPSSESLKTIAIDEHFSPGRCQVQGDPRDTQLSNT
jgi:hypothetical protein